MTVAPKLNMLKELTAQVWSLRRLILFCEPKDIRKQLTNNKIYAIIQEQFDETEPFQNF